MTQKILKPSSSYFLSQTFWRVLRNLVGKNIWTFFYKLSQKIKIFSKFSILKKSNLNLKENLDYPIYKNSEIKKTNNFSYYLKKYKSSKPEGEYRDFLDNLLSDTQNKYKTILEIGISEGAGIFSLRDYYSNSYIWGVDIDPATFITNETQIKKCDCVDQLKLNSLTLNAEKFSTKYDLIVDDGWHHPESQINSLIAYLPYLNLNGLYIVEDIVHRDYYKIFLRVKDILAQKNFEVSYHKFHVPGKAGISDLLGYMTIKRK